MGILISTQLNVKCSELVPLKPYAMSVLLRWESRSILVINVYLPPGKKKAEVAEVWDKFENYVSSLIMDHPEASIMLAGDLNTRLGPNDPFLEKKYSTILKDPEDTLASLLLPRSFRDQYSNYSGLCLMNFVLKQNLYLLNGSLKSDRPGAYTYMAGFRCSTIDYILICPILLKQIKKFEILPYLEGDHFPLHLQVSNYLSQCYLKSRWPIDIDLDSRTRCRVKWSPKLLTDLKGVLDNQDLQSFNLACFNPSENQNPIMFFEALILELGLVLFKTIQNKGSREIGIRHSKPWFDKECVEVKMQLKKVYGNSIRSQGKSSEEGYD